jgi:catechol 2,3-dioxygenase-like lactoylglutathione lyase family enzyme
VTVTWSITIDCWDAGVLASFWATALGYVEKPAPEGFASWEEWLTRFEVPPEEWGDGAGLVDPDGVAPSIGFLKVPEAKSVKNRMHLDLQVSGGRHVAQPVRLERITATVARLTAAGARVLREHDGPDGLDHVVMADPEGNEFCVV